ncbi:FAD/NAD(P)-binding domain-containing protein [Cryphonectria parasitica EP155]|uniref:FAD/NAD(P)-binding domain-containing protein n=1 Tax=Cryphonectria parasitica (strain ATCC 38755 / EP155) TaxID=660469 RepID=A0A9P4Y532_CRYP1|nr:FAD/NAD(P)-binding domain-containing protein [Cryphonectria parasitica EP155]KAF3766645.1 FAD/NAD(P)-binding domain-containing protein [Cryphonectria parasitica EP155]
MRSSCLATSNTMHVLVVGAGVGGLSLAQTLRKQDISFEIFERDDHADARFQGWAIAMHSIVESLLSTFPSDMPDLRASTNHLLPLNLPAQLALYTPGREDRWGFQDSPRFPFIRAERRRLRNWLSTSIPVQWGKHVQRIEHDDHGVSVYFQDGSSAKGDILIGADGINSVVREHLLGRPAADLLAVVPLATVVGQLELSGEALRRQLALGHSGYMLIRPDLGFIGFAGLHYVNPDGLSARYYWNFLQSDEDVARPDHWLKTAGRQEKLDHVLRSIQALPPKFREIFEMTRPEQIRDETHVWRDLELDRKGGLPAGRVILMGDAAHAMTPFRGEGGYHTLVDSIVLSKVLGDLHGTSGFRDIATVKQAVADYNSAMLKRAGQAVRDSRNLHTDAQRFGPDGKPLVLDIVPLPDVEIKLGRE